MVRSGKVMNIFMSFKKYGFEGKRVIDGKKMPIK